MLLVVIRTFSASFIPILDVEKLLVCLEIRSIYLCRSRIVSRDSMLAVRYHGSVLHSNTIRLVISSNREVILVAGHHPQGET